MEVVALAIFFIIVMATTFYTLGLLFDFFHEFRDDLVGPHKDRTFLFAFVGISLGLGTLNAILWFIVIAFAFF